MSDNEIIILIICGAGVLTGLTNYVVTCDLSRPIKENCIKLLSSILLSTCASFTIPLFLQILSNNLLDKPNFKGELILCGFCILAGFFSKRFLEDLYAKVRNLERKVDKRDEETDNKLNQTESKLNQTAKNTEAINKKIEDLEESIEEVEPDIMKNEIAESLKLNSTVEFNESEIESLSKSLFSPKYSLRTIKGISDESKIPEGKVRLVMEHLKNFGFAENKDGADGKTYWRLLKYPIKIYSANYGITGHYVDVASKINQMIAAGDYTGIASQTFLGIPDPAPGIVKKLKVHYRIQGKEKDLTVNEGDQFRIE